MPRHKLTDEQKKDLKDRLAQKREDGKPKFRNKELAYQFGISAGNVSKLKTGRLIYKNI